MVRAVHFLLLVRVILGFQLVQVLLCFRHVLAVPEVPTGLLVLVLLVHLVDQVDLVFLLGLMALVVLVDRALLFVQVILVGHQFQVFLGKINGFNKSSTLCSQIVYYIKKLMIEQNLTEWNLIPYRLLRALHVVQQVPVRLSVQPDLVALADLVVLVAQVHLAGLHFRLCQVDLKKVIPC